jgi:hypothetical protein
MVRRLPIEGATATVVHLAEREPAVIEAVHDGGRRLTVITESGRVLHFRLAGNGHFVAEGAAHPRLLLD